MGRDENTLERGKLMERHREESSDLMDTKQDTFTLKREASSPVV